MANTALDIAQRVSASIGINVPSTLRSTQDPNANLMLALLNRSGQVLSRKRGPFGGSWTELTREHVVTTVANKDEYALPQGFAELITGTAWDRSTYRAAPGPVTPQEWQRLKGGLLDTVALTPRYRIVYSENTNQRVLRLDPVPASTGERIAFEHLTRFWVRESENAPVAHERVTEDGHVPVFETHLVELDLEWRVRKSQGLNYRTDIAEFELERDRLFAQSHGLRDVYMSPNAEDTLNDGNIPESIPV